MNNTYTINTGRTNPESNPKLALGAKMSLDYTREDSEGREMVPGDYYVVAHRVSLSTTLDDGSRVKLYSVELVEVLP